MPKIEAGRGVVRHAVSLDSSKCIIHAPNKVVATLGVKNMVVIDTEDAILIMQRSRAQHVGDLVRLLDDSDIEGVT